MGLVGAEKLNSYNNPPLRAVDYYNYLMHASNGAH